MRRLRPAAKGIVNEPDELVRDTVDTTFVRGMVVLRWLVLVAYISLALVHVLTVTTTALWTSAALLSVYFSLFTWRVARRGASTRFVKAVPVLDTLGITVILSALHDPSNPFWAAYFLTNVVAAHFLTRRQSLMNGVWTNMCYLGACAATLLQGYTVEWPVVAIVSVLIHFMGHHASALAGSHERVRAVIVKYALTDALTGLPNRNVLQNELRRRLRETDATRLSVAVMIADVDHFKEINDRQGHSAGDLVLRSLASVLTSVLREQDTLVRYGGDEFLVVAPAVDRLSARDLAERLRGAAQAAGVSLSIGVALYPDDAQEAATLIDAADRALYRAKEFGRDQVRDAAAA